MFMWSCLLASFMLVNYVSLSFHCTLLHIFLYWVYPEGDNKGFVIHQSILVMDCTWHFQCSVLGGLFSVMLIIEKKRKNKPRISEEIMPFCTPLSQVQPAHCTFPLQRVLDAHAYLYMYRSSGYYKGMKASTITSYNVFWDSLSNPANTSHLTSSLMKLKSLHKVLCLKNLKICIRFCIYWVGPNKKSVTFISICIQIVC